MEEVWKDITLPSLNDLPAGSLIYPRVHNPNFPGMILLDVLATPINCKETPTPGTSDVPNGTSLAGATALFYFKPPTPGTILSLNPCSDLQYVDSGDPVRPNPAVKTPTGVAAAPSFSPSTVFTSFRQKRAPESNEKPEDRRNKRMMKNRESAARSRARKQAYTTELELKVAHLQEENAKLRRQQEKLLSAPDQPPKKNTLTRTLTAPF
ncbi:hypothetical protein like AT4G35900 [Hibiscus trionum]|uniref:BZIP domain-containing protein n=1 Tax=Hibiscus trionum TaxID=183268 RepID=A0A9W7I9F9_HIBTR|nr:hypothetical protein like AT4G35900 [Hibiscus trionum]